MRLLCGDCLDVLPTLPDESVDLIFCDPPYNIGIFSKMPPDEYLSWCDAWIGECSRVLAANGAFWMSHSKPLVLARLSEMIAGHGRGLVNWVVWDKWNGGLGENGNRNASWVAQYRMFNNTHNHRSFCQAAEYLIYHADEGEWTAQCDRERGFIFEPLRAYLEGERDRAGLTTGDLDRAWQARMGTKGCMAGHWFGRSQWMLPTEESYQWLRRTFHALNEGGEYLRRDYEYLRRDYEDLRYTFNNPGKVSSVWQIPPAPSNGHPTPKPEALLERIILATSNEGDTVLDPFMGSGTTGAVAVRLGRDFTGIDISEKWVAFSEKRIGEAQAQPTLEGLS